MSPCIRCLWNRAGASDFPREAGQLRPSARTVSQHAACAQSRAGATLTLTPATLHPVPRLHGGNKTCLAGVPVEGAPGNIASTFLFQGRHLRHSEPCVPRSERGYLRAGGTPGPGGCLPTCMGTQEWILSVGAGAVHG